MGLFRSCKRRAGPASYARAHSQIPSAVWRRTWRRIPQPRDWAANIVSGATYNLDSGEGQHVWLECLARAATRQSAEIRMVAEERARYGEPVLVQPRLGQGTFRIAVTDAYRRACAVSGEHSLPVLDVAHIKPYGEGGE